MPLSPEVVKERLDVFVNGVPSIDGKGLSQEESVELFQHLTDTGEIYTMDSMLQHWAAALAEAGEVKGFDPTKAKLD